MDEFRMKKIQLTSQREFALLLRRAFSKILLYKDFIQKQSMSEEEKLSVLNEVPIEVCSSSRKHLLDRPQQHDCEKPIKIMKSSQLENAEATLACTGYSCSFGSYYARSSESQDQQSCDSLSSLARWQPSTPLFRSSSDSENTPNSNVSSSVTKLCVRNHNRVLFGASADAAECSQTLPSSKSYSEDSSFVSDIECEHLPDQVLYFPASVANEFEAFPSIFERHMKRYGSENSDAPSSSNVSNRTKISVKKAKKKARMKHEKQKNSASSLAGNNLSKRWVEIDEDISVMSADSDELKQNIELQTTERHWEYVDEDIFCMVKSNECCEPAPPKGGCSSYTEEGQTGANALMINENGHGCKASVDNVASNLFKSSPVFLHLSTTMGLSEIVQDDLAYILYLFPSTHASFQVVQESPNELRCTFIISEGNVIDVRVTISDDFPRTPLIWYSSSDDMRVIEILGCLLKSHDGSGIVRYFRRLLKAFYSIFDVKEPPQLEYMKEGKCPPTFSRKKKDVEIIDLTKSDDEKIASTSKVVPPISQPSASLQNTVALKRLMKEFKAVNESESVKDGIFSVSLINDCLFKWEVQLKKFYKDSRLAKDLIVLKERQGYDYVLLNILFPKTYPFDPPFVHVVKPIINNGYVVSGGAICMELLTPGGWSSCYLVESLILQIAATLVEGEADIVFNGNLSNYSLRKAQASFKMLDFLHRNSGWGQRNRS
ncbi:Ubiquitin-conjugating enzyme E2 Q2 [Trichinella zimbabwensis]|uniref:Ubiquitin-conjugating enzyme E2 Q2 n=1 Tax=Trichinella zimbabwensis TaxID=268475 RepID=A0A0V1H6J1_9BILA|nr:Ubiquitin-conjugating enzyme E2 Q2 [Trichinella zimbabwensis]